MILWGCVQVRVQANSCRSAYDKELKTLLGRCYGAYGSAYEDRTSFGPLVGCVHTWFYMCVCVCLMCVCVCVIGIVVRLVHAYHVCMYARMYTYGLLCLYAYRDCLCVRREPFGPGNEVCMSVHSHVHAVLRH